MQKTFIIVDWSAANAPNRGKDSIWIAKARHNGSKIIAAKPTNPPTRSAAMTAIAAMMAEERAAGRQVVAGFDFPFGYPAGAAQLIAGRRGWKALWRIFQEAVADDESNRSNRYALADQWNREKFPAPFYWGRPHQHDYADLPATKPRHDALAEFEFRHVERWRPPAKSVWQLAYNGAVGSQAMLGIARLEALRRTLGEDCAVWPFETSWDTRLDAPIILTEVYPSMFAVRPKAGEVKDAAQVRTVARAYARLDAAGRFKSLLARPAGLDDAANRAVLSEEGWIVGAGHEGNES